MMVAEHKILLDSCVLANFAVCDLFLRLAEKPRLILPRWSKKILIEVRRTHTEKLGWSDSIADSFQNALQDNFPEAEVQDYDNLIPIVFARLTDIAINRKQDLETTVIDFGKSLPKFTNALLEDIG